MKTDYKYILDNSSVEQFTVNSKLYDLGRSAEVIKKLAENEIQEKGEFAKLYSSNVAEWMQDIADQAQKILDIQFRKE